MTLPNIFDDHSIWKNFKETLKKFCVLNQGLPGGRKLIFLFLIYNPMPCYLRPLTDFLLILPLFSTQNILRFPLKKLFTLTTKLNFSQKLVPKESPIGFPDFVSL